MGFFRGPNIVKNGLTLCLDAANPRSYPGTGTVWTDLAQSLTFNAIGSLLPLESKNGALSFAFDGTGYWRCATNYSLVDLGGDCTIILWLYDENVTTRKTVFEKAGTSYSSYEQEIAMTWEEDETISWYSRKAPAYDYSATPALSANVWTMASVKMSTGKSTTARTGFYSMNGAAWTSSYTSRSDTALIASGEIRVGTGYSGTCENGNVSIVMCYNRMLNDVEILQNYNAYKTRFGL